MAIINTQDVNNKFSKIGNSNGKSRATVASHRTDTSNIGVYIDDNSYANVYKESILMQNPANSSLEAEGPEHLQPYINIFKTVDFAVGRYAAEDSASWRPLERNGFGNWRTDFGINVHPNVQLQVDSKIVSVGFEQNFESLWDKVMGNKIISAVDDMASNARMFGGSANPSITISKYKQVPVLKDVSTMKVPSSIKFEFSFGSAGLFSAEEEVVKPILAIAKAFIAKQTGEQFVSGNAPSTEYALSKVVKSIWRKTQSAIKSLESAKSSDDNSDDSSSGGRKLFDLGSDGSEALGAVADVLTRLQEVVYSCFNDAAKEVLTSSYRTIKIRYGRFALPWMLVKSVNIEFDFSTVDEYGFPYKGTISLDGLETCTVGTSGMLGSTVV